MSVDGISRGAGQKSRQLVAERVSEKAPASQVAKVETAKAETARPRQVADGFDTRAVRKNQVATTSPELFQAKSTTATTPAVPASSTGARLPAIQSNTNTVQAGTVALDEQTKKARGAVKIEAAPGEKLEPKKYDGMYIGADGYAYPPDKFDVSEVPPFKPEKPVAAPTPTTYYVNGILTGPLGEQHANGEAQKLANKTGTNVVLIYNATESEQADITQTAMDRLGVGDNKAADTLANAIYNDLKAGKQVNVMGYSQGGAIVSHALRDVDERISKDQGGFFANLPVIGDDNKRTREALLGNVNVTSFAGAGKTFPDGPRYNFYVNKQDPVPNWLGSHGFNPGTDLPSAILGGLAGGLVGALNGGSSLQLPRGGVIHTFDSAGSNPDIFSVDGKHGIDTYLENIQDSVS